ncbi:MAG: glycine zipper family protein [Gammaproteobacteria bacterium]
MKRSHLFLLTCLMYPFSSDISAELYVFPAKGQSETQMEQDKFSCYGWAKQQTGFDPMNPPSVPSASSGSRGSLIGGAAKGAAAGAVIGAIAGDAGKGAAIGAATGGIGRALGNRADRRVQGQVDQQQANQISQMQSNYDRAYAVCLEGKGYTVK